MGRWSYHDQGYAYYNAPGKTRVYLHRFVLGLTPDDPLVDHEDGDKLNCQKSNLRLSDKSRNGSNQALTNDRHTSKYRGVFWDRTRQRWRAEVVVESKHHHLGRYRLEEDAYDAVCRFRHEQGIPGYR